MKYDLTNFKTIEMVKGNPTMSLTRNGITFSQAAIQKLAKPEYVEFMIDENNKIIAVVAKKEKTSNSFSFFSPEKKVMSVRISNKDLRNQIAEIMSWSLGKEDGYKIEGEYAKEENALFFNLKESKPLNK